jgi:site-specific DNA recombinase
MMRDIELGKIQAVMFTELSRLSRSLKDFLNIFEFAQKHRCDLVCLKTEIDTTSPYKSLITKILMIFAEFEREMTSRRTAINAYERSKRGLANGGAAPLGYKRAKQKKGRLFIDEREKRIVEDIFQTYMRLNSIRKTTDHIIKKYGTDSPRLKKMSGTKVYAILTNKTYIGIRVINTHDKLNREEVQAVWEPIIDRETFEKVQALLRKNRDTFHLRGNGRYLYHFSGLFRCGKCGGKLQGQSAYSCADKRHYYYSHKGTCAKGGINRIDAETAHSLVFGWLRNLAEERDQFKRLQAEGRQRMQEEMSQLDEEGKRLQIEKEGIGEQIEARIRELVKSKSETVRKSIEKSIETLEASRREAEGKLNYVNHTISSLENLMKNDQELFTAYAKNIREALAQVERSGQVTGTEDEIARNSASMKAKSALKALIPSLVLEDKDIKIALSGVNRKALHSSEFGLAPPIGRV